MATGSSTAAVGYVDDAGFAYSGGYGELIDALLEYVPDLLWPLSVRTFSRMRTDPQVGATLKAYTLPIRRANWALDPAGCRDEVVRDVADNLGLDILGDDPNPAGARRRGVVWGKHLRLALLDLVFGHMPFERTYELDPGTGRFRINLLQERMPQTIGQIYVNGDGTLKSIAQNALAGIHKEAPEIGAESLVWYANDREGSNWTGRSLLRPAYAPWLIKHELWRVHSTSIRRFGMGVPSVEAPLGATPQQVAEAQRLASAMRAGDQSGVGLPPGFRMALTGITGSVPDALGFINYLDQQITRNMLTQFLDLGSTPNGSRALGDTFMDLLFLSLQTIADEHADQATEGIVVPLVDVNWGEGENVPRVVCTDIGEGHEVTAETIDLLVKSGVLTNDPELEDYIRKQYRLPEKVGAPAAPTPAPTPSPLTASRRKVAAASSAFRREPTPVEAASGADFVGLQADWESSLDKLANEWSSISDAQRASLIDQVKAAVTDEDMAALGSISIDSSAAAASLLAMMRTMAESAVSRTTEEAAGQGIDVAKVTVDEERLSGMATAMSSLTAQGLAAYAARTALGAWAPDATADDVASAVDSSLDDLTGSTLRDSLGAALSAAQSEGRAAVFDSAPEATYYASEIMDSATCEACAEIDGHAYASLDEAQADYANGGYINCQGGLRCRGILVAVWGQGAAE